MDEVRARVVIHGRVQGVFFRDSARREARARGLTGWVRNQPDGSVEAVIQGERAAVEALVRWCHTGPPEAAVAAVDLAWEPPVPGTPAFHIR